MARKAACQIEDRSGRSVLVNNAARDDRHTIAEVTPEYWDDRINVNLRHQFFMAQPVVPGMAKAGGGSIVNLGSTSWMVCTDDLAVYQTAKAGVVGLTRGLARDLAVAHPGQPCGAGLDHDRAAEEPLGDAGSLKRRWRGSA